MTSKFLIEIELFEMCTIHMISKHMKISHKENLLCYGTSVLYEPYITYILDKSISFFNNVQENIYTGRILK